MRVLDASALLAFLFGEPGSEAVEDALRGGVVPATSWAEVLQKARQKGGDAGEVRAVLEQAGIEVADVTAAEAERAAALWQPRSTLSLADRLCIALGQILDLPIWTCDREWADVDPRVVVLR